MSSHSSDEFLIVELVGTYGNSWELGGKMRLEIIIRVTEEKVVVEVPEKGWRKEYTNLIAIHQGKKLIVDLGQPLEKMQKENLERWREEAEQIKYLPLYDPDDFDPEITGNGLLYFKVHALRESQSRLRQFFTQSNLSLWLPGNYLESVGEVHEQLELVLQQTISLYTLKINGQVVGWPRWQRKLAMAYQAYQL